MTSTRPQCSILFLITLSTVSRTLTSHSIPTQFLSCSHVFICSMVFSWVHPTAVHLSPWDSSARASDLPMWPVAPNTCTQAISDGHQQRRHATHNPYLWLLRTVLRRRIASRGQLQIRVMRGSCWRQALASRVEVHCRRCSNGAGLDAVPGGGDVGSLWSQSERSKGAHRRSPEPLVERAFTLPQSQRVCARVPKRMQRSEIRAVVVFQDSSAAAS